MYNERENIDRTRHYNDMWMSAMQMIKVASLALSKRRTLVIMCYVRGIYDMYLLYLLVNVMIEVHNFFFSRVGKR